MHRPMHLAAVMLLSGPAMAQEHVIQDHRNAVCVTCVEPDKTYRCKAAAAEQHQLFLKNREFQIYDGDPPLQEDDEFYDEFLEEDDY